MYAVFTILTGLIVSSLALPHHYGRSFSYRYKFKRPYQNYGYNKHFSKNFYNSKKIVFPGSRGIYSPFSTTQSLNPSLNPVHNTYNPLNNPSVQGFNPSNNPFFNGGFNPLNNPSVQGFNPLNNPSVQGFNPLNNPSVQGFNPLNKPSVEGFNPLNNPFFNQGLNPNVSPQIQNSPPSQPLQTDAQKTGRAVIPINKNQDPSAKEATYGFGGLIRD